MTAREAAQLCVLFLARAGSALPAPVKRSKYKRRRTLEDEDAQALDALMRRLADELPDGNLRPLMGVLGVRLTPLRHRLSRSVQMRWLVYKHLKLTIVKRRAELGTQRQKGGAAVQAAQAVPVRPAGGGQDGGRA